ncbi:MAG: polysaccharide biosynthesis protein [Clostridiales bacterium]|nr:polysaccharide biosynthesis protein [Clostridiales bacterium]
METPSKTNNQNNENKKDSIQGLRSKTFHVRWLLVLYDFLMYLVVCFLLIVLHPSDNAGLSIVGNFTQIFLGVICIFGMRFVADVYRQIWRYGGMKAYVHLIVADVIGGILYFILESLLPIEHIVFIRTFSIVCLNLLGAITMRIIYNYIYQFVDQPTKLGSFLRKFLHILTGVAIDPDEVKSGKLEDTRIKIAIVGAGRVGTALADELLNNPTASYTPCCFIDIKKEKIGRSIYGIPVLSEREATHDRLNGLGVQEIVFALPQISAEARKELYEYYKQTGCKIKIYDYPTMRTAGTGKRHLREFDIEELLFRQPIEFNNAKTKAYYRDKVILITGGGGSIGSELSRQIAKMNPKQLIILDVYENGAYDVQQELRIAYGSKLNLQVEIVSVCDRVGLEKVFATYHPDILLHAAAHKHVPLMEHNCCEAVKNNVFGTLNTVELAEKYGVGRFIMVSTDKAVNPTNVMGATKRMCEMIVQSHSRMTGDGTHKTVFSATRFGNVLGSAGSVIPLFKRQIMNGGPITITDKRIIRYFMTIPEASQLVLQSGAMAKNGELFVLDMGKPVQIMELAKNMIKLSGYEPYKDIDIIETGLRPGEKLYEELLIRTEELDKTDNSLIFIERDTPLMMDEINNKLDVLRKAVLTEDDDTVRNALRSVVPTFRNMADVNAEAEKAQEMKMVTPSPALAEA